jgi:glycine cleavage system regulatory protein
MMISATTYEELEQQIMPVKKDADAYKRLENALKESEGRYGILTLIDKAEEKTKSDPGGEK